MKVQQDKALELPPPVFWLYAKLSIKISYFAIRVLRSVMVISTHISFASVIITCLLRYSGKCSLIIRCLFAAQLTGKLITCLINYRGSYISYAHHNVVNPINMENPSVREGETAPLGTLTRCQCHSGSLGSWKLGERGDVSCVPL